MIKKCMRFVQHHNPISPFTAVFQQGLWNTLQVFLRVAVLAELGRKGTHPVRVNTCTCQALTWSVVQISREALQFGIGDGVGQAAVTTHLHEFTAPHGLVIIILDATGHLKGSQSWDSSDTTPTTHAKGHKLIGWEKRGQKQRTRWSDVLLGRGVHEGMITTTQPNPPNQ